ncbi:MAG: FtsQ-type POTRA domain-containing protein [Candidatus Vogelbacteria bacterium]|nr:FtsQ-type POTRA domain-containing protein [Candidatus Vogelbacteria bacterium]
MKLYTNKNVLVKAKAARRHRAFKHFGYLLILFLFIIISSIFVLNNKSLNLQTIVITGTVFVSKTEVAKIIDDEMRGFHLGIIPKKSFMFYPKNSIRERILSSFDRVYAATFTEESPSELLVTVHERVPDAVWCEGEFNRSTERRCYYVDKIGLLYDVAPSFSGPVYFEYYGYLRESPRLGNNVLDLEQIIKIQEFRRELIKNNIEPISILIKSDKSYELMTGQGWKVFFSSDAPVELMIKHLNLTLLSEILTKRVTDKKSKLEYIDLRYGEKVFYKFVEIDLSGSNVSNKPVTSTSTNAR